VQTPADPELVPPLEVPDDPDDPELVPPLEVPDDPELVPPLEVPDDPELVPPLEVPDDPELVPPLEVPDDPELVPPLEVPDDPELVPRATRDEVNASSPVPSEGSLEPHAMAAAVSANGRRVTKTFRIAMMWYLGASSGPACRLLVHLTNPTLERDSR
jgi:hypothetical protein